MREFSSFFVLVVFAQGFPTSGQADADLPSDLRIRQMLGVIDQQGGEQKKLIGLGAKLFPAYIRILTAEDVTATEKSRIFAALAQVDGNREQFLDHAVAALPTRNDRVQSSAVQLLKQIGTSRESAPIVALLFDTNPVTKHTAADALRSIGDRRTVDALQVWLNVPANQNPRYLYDHVTKCRNDLFDRLERERKATPPKK